MKYNMFVSLVKGLLTGDNAFPNDSSIQASLLGYAYDKVSNEADALRLFKSDSNGDILRDGPGSFYLRKPNMPEINSGVIDIEYEIDLDEELCYPLARYFASFITKDKMKHHQEEAESLIRRYNSKVEAHVNKIKQRMNQWIVQFIHLVL